MAESDRFKNLHWLDRKHLLLLSLISVSILLNVVLFSDRITSSLTRSITSQIPVVFWIVLFLSSLLCFFTAKVWKDWKVSMLMAVCFFFLFYSYNLFFRLIPTHTDIGAAGFDLWFFENKIYLDVNANYYYEYPIYFSFAAFLMKALGLSGIGLLNIGFFLILLLFPMSIVTLIHKGNKGYSPFLFFLFPVLYLILIFFYFNDQFVPQFIGLFFVIATTGAYIQLERTGDIRFLLLTLFFYTVCVFSHPFMFVFFFLGVLFNKIYHLAMNGFNFRIKMDFGVGSESSVDFVKKIVTRRKNIIGSFKDKSKIIFKRISDHFFIKKKKRSVSLLSLTIIFLSGYYFRFNSISLEIRRALTPSDSRGGSWVLISYITGDKSVATTVPIKISPLFHLIPEWIYLLSRYSIFAILITLVVILIFAFIVTRNDQILSIDIMFVLGSLVFLIAGFISPTLLGQRATQTIFLTPTKYYNSIRGKMLIIVSLIVIISPVLYTFNISVNQTLDGNMFIEDDSTLDPGLFTQTYRPKNITVLTPDRRFYPVSLTRFYRESGYYNMNPYTFLYTDEFDIDDGDIILYSPKLENRMSYFGIEQKLEIRNNCSCIYDQGLGKIYLIP